MSERNLSNPVFFIVVLLFILVALIACQPQPVATPLPALPTVLATATAPAKSSAAATSNASASSKASSSAAPKVAVVRTVEEVTKSAPTSQFLDGKHVAKGLQCTSCHTTMPPKGAPAMTVCLNCHLGSMTALAEKTNKVDPNPHKFHEEVESCADCHTGHGPFVYGCGKAGCHIEYSNNRFK